MLWIQFNVEYVNFDRYVYDDERSNDLEMYFRFETLTL